MHHIASHRGALSALALAAALLLALCLLAAGVAGVVYPGHPAIRRRGCPGDHRDEPDRAAS